MIPALFQTLSSHVTRYCWLRTTKKTLIYFTYLFFIRFTVDFRCMRCICVCPWLRAGAAYLIFFLSFFCWKKGEKKLIIWLKCSWWKKIEPRQWKIAGSWWTFRAEANTQCITSRLSRRKPFCSERVYSSWKRKLVQKPTSDWCTSGILVLMFTNVDYGFYFSYCPHRYKSIQFR